MDSRKYSSSSSSSGRTCLCSPTVHPGSFRCSLHRIPSRGPNPKSQKSRAVDRSRKLLVSKVGIMKAFLIQLIKPSSHDLQRRRNFQPKPTRFCSFNHNDGHTTQNNQVVVS